MAKKDKKLGWKIGTVIIIVVFGLFIWGVISLFWMGGTEKIEAEANQFKPAKNWTLTEEHIETPKSFCGDVACPSVYRKWNTGETLTKQELASILREAKWNLQIEGDCLPSMDTSSHFITTCSARGLVDNKYHVYVGVSTTKAGQESRVTLGVEEQK